MWDDIGQYIYWTIMLGAAGFLCGIVFPVLAPNMSQELFSSLASFAKGVLDRPAWQVFLFVFFNNTVKTFGAVLFGVLAGVIPVLFIFGNGVLIGMVTVMVGLQNGMTYVLAGLLPHAIFEIPGVVIAAAVGMLLGVRLIQRIRGTLDRSLVYELVQGGRFFVVFVVPLLLVAAIIEVYVTPFLLNAVS